MFKVLGWFVMFRRLRLLIVIAPLLCGCSAAAIALSSHVPSATETRIRDYLAKNPGAIKTVVDVKPAEGQSKDFLDGQPAQEWYALVDLNRSNPYAATLQTTIILYVSDKAIISGPPFPAGRITHGE